MNEKEFNKIRKIFESYHKSKGYTTDDIDGDITEDFCQELQIKLDQHYSNV